MIDFWKKVEEDDRGCVFLERLVCSGYQISWELDPRPGAPYVYVGAYVGRRCLGWGGGRDPVEALCELAQDLGLGDWDPNATEARSGQGD